MNALSLIAGNWEDGKQDAFVSYNPSNGTKIGAHKGVSSEQLNTAVEAAQKAYESFKAVDFETRALLLETAADELEALGDELLNTCNAETGLGLPRLTGERGRTCGQLRAFAALVRKGDWQQARIDTAIPDRKPLPKPDVRRVLRPIGPVAVFSASNFPLAFSTLGGDTASALAAGNPVVVKGHPSHPKTSELSAKAMLAAVKKLGLPEGLFSVLQSNTPEVSTTLVKHPFIKAVGFTGSTFVGRILFEAGASREVPIPVYAEMGSTNPLFVLETAMNDNVDTLAQGLAGSITLGTGQFCTQPGLIFLEKSEKSAAFKKNLAKAIDAIQTGYLLNAGIKKSLGAKLEAYKLKDELALLSGGDTQSGTLFSVSAKAFIANSDLEEEVFGPVALIIECDSKAEMFEAASKLGGHLTGTIHADNNDETAVELCQILEEHVGRIIFNGFPTGVEVCDAMHHGGPYPSSTFPATTSVGSAAIERFCKVVCYQNTPQALLPEALKDQNSRGIIRLLNGQYTKKNV